MGNRGLRSSERRAEEGNRETSQARDPYRVQDKGEGESGRVELWERHWRRRQKSEDARGTDGREEASRGKSLGRSGCSNFGTCGRPPEGRTDGRSEGVQQCA